MSIQRCGSASAFCFCSWPRAFFGRRWLFPELDAKFDPLRMNLGGVFALVFGCLNLVRWYVARSHRLARATPVRTPLQPDPSVVRRSRRIRSWISRRSSGRQTRPTSNRLTARRASRPPFAARVLVLPLQVPERHRHPEPRRGRARRHDADLLPVAEELRPGRERPALEHLQPQERPDDVPGPVAGHDDRLLAEEAALRVAHRPREPRRPPSRSGSRRCRCRRPASRPRSAASRTSRGVPGSRPGRA